LSIRYYEVSIDSLKDQLKIVLEKLHNLVIAVLFGSVLKRRMVRDIDVGVYFQPREDLKDIINLAGILEDEIRIPIDIVPLQKLPPKLRLKVLLDGVQLIVRDNNLYWVLVSQALGEVSDMELKNRLRSYII
jgi:predicted nucleotidyltransferase